MPKEILEARQKIFDDRRQIYGRLNGLIQGGVNSPDAKNFKFPKANSVPGLDIQLLRTAYPENQDINPKPGKRQPPLKQLEAMIVLLKQLDQNAK